MSPMMASTSAALAGSALVALYIALRVRRRPSEPANIDPVETTVVDPPRRVVSLLGAATETIYRLGLGQRLVGRSHECDYPPAVLSLPMISKPRLDAQAPSAEIDAKVREYAAAGEPVYSLNDAALSRLAPDLLIAQDHCRVCAVTPREVRGSSCANVKQLVLRPATLADALGDVQRVADAMGVPERGRTLVHTLESRLARVRELSEAACRDGLSSQLDARPRPAAARGSARVVRPTGLRLPAPGARARPAARPCSARHPAATPTITFAQLLGSAPDVVIFALCGFDAGRAVAEVRRAGGDADLARLRRACGNRLFVVDGNLLVNRSGPRVVESAEAIAEAIHPPLQGHFGHFGTPLLCPFDEAPPAAPPKPRPAADDPAPPAAATTSCVRRAAAAARRPGGGRLRAARAARRGGCAPCNALNSRANQDRWCGPERFEAVLRGHPDFAQLLVKDSGVAVASCEANGNVATVHVSLPGRVDHGPSKGASGSAAGGVSMVWTMVVEEQQLAGEADRSDGGGGGLVWRTEKVMRVDEASS